MERASFAVVQWEQLELEGLANAVRARAHLDDDELLSSLTIARRVLGTPVRVLRSLPTHATITRIEGRYCILIDKLDREAHFAVAHELGHWALNEIARYRGPDDERYANRIAGAITAPRAVVKWMVDQHGRELGPVRPLARTTGISQTAANLRLAEVLDDERAVLTGKHCHLMVRSSGRFEWDRNVVMNVVRGEADEPRLESTPLRGGIDARRFALRAR